jgi:hypothetical protein
MISVGYKLILENNFMSVTKLDSIKQYFVGSLIVSIIGGFTILLGDFAGWDYSNYYLGFFETGYIDVSLENPLSAIILGSCALLLFFVSYTSFQALSDPQQEGLAEKVQLGIYTSVTSLTVLLIGGLLFATILILEGDTDWWLDLGFYGGVIGSGLTLALLYLIKKELT